MHPTLIDHRDGKRSTVIGRNDELLCLAARQLFAFVEGVDDEKAAPARFLNSSDTAVRPRDAACGTNSVRIGRCH
jgi:hypothetical protein